MWAIRTGLGDEGSIGICRFPMGLGLRWTLRAGWSQRKVIRLASKRCLLHSRHRHWGEGCFPCQPYQMNHWESVLDESHAWPCRCLCRTTARRWISLERDRRNWSYFLGWYSSGRNLLRSTMHDERWCWQWTCVENNCARDCSPVMTCLAGYNWWIVLCQERLDRKQRKWNDNCWIVRSTRLLREDEDDGNHLDTTVARFSDQHPGDRVGSSGEDAVRRETRSDVLCVCHRDLSGSSRFWLGCRPTGVHPIRARGHRRSLWHRHRTRLDSDLLVGVDLPGVRTRRRRFPVGESRERNNWGGSRESLLTRAIYSNVNMCDVWTNERDRSSDWQESVRVASTGAWAFFPTDLSLLRQMILKINWDWLLIEPALILRHE